jgi:hypothetical protein
VREAPIAPLSDPALLAELREREAWSASAVELWAGCPVKWFVERRLAPEGLTPDPELMLRGALAHLVLEVTLRGLTERTGSARLHEPALPVARELVEHALDDLAPRPDLLMSRDPRRQRALLRRLRADLLRYVEHAARSGSEFVPGDLEVEFGAPGGERPALELPDGVRLRGRIDRVDRAGSEAIVYDYKGRTAVAPANWRKERKFQIALYLLAARDVLGLNVVGGFYQPLGGREERPRGLLHRDADPGLRTFRDDRQDPEGVAEIVDGVVADVLQAVGELRAGALAPRPDSCAYEGGCAYPTICRCDAA